MIKVSLKSLIAKPFYKVHKDIKAGGHTHYWLKGGRGSTKSTFTAVEIILGMMRDADNGEHTNAVALRKVANNLKTSVHEQLVWAIDKLGVSHLWDSKTSPQTLTYLPTGQRILFRGADDPKKIKSIVFAKGYCKYVWYEELDEFDGMEEIRSINQSLLRGGEQFFVFYTYNPPQSVNNWVNAESQMTRPDRLVHHSTYLDVPPEWLGVQFIIEAEHLKEINPDKYDHEYMGEVTGTGGEVFTNVVCRAITDAEIKGFYNVKRGLDFGYAVDPLSYGAMHYDRKYKRLYIFYELYKVGMSNREAARIIAAENKANDTVYADSAEPKSIAEIRAYGVRIQAVKKGPDSIEFGVKFLQDLEQIIIDDVRCPETAREFLTYELAKDAQGNFKAGFPDKDNHSIDMVRYALNFECMQFKDEQQKKKESRYDQDYRRMIDSITGGEFKVNL